jgi:hypothetical protein
LDARLLSRPDFHSFPIYRGTTLEKARDASIASMR